MNLPSIRVSLLAVVLAVLIGCSSGSNSTSPVPVTPMPSTPDIGTITTVGDTNQFTLTNVSSGVALGIAGQSQVAGAALAQESATGATDDMWHAMPMGTNQNEYNIENMLTHQVMGISNASTAAGAMALQWADNGTNDHLWEFYKLTDGNYLLKNVNSGLYLEDANSGTTSSAVIDQNARATTGTGCTCQEWTVTQTSTAAYPAPRAVSGTGIYVHDPFMLRDTNGTYWLYGTHQTLAYSTDLTTFTYTTASSAYGACTTTQGGAWLTLDNHCPIIGPDFASWTGLQTPPSDNNGANVDVWAPSLMYVNGTYYQYYSVPVEPDTAGGEAIIGLATSTSPSGPWTDKGWIVRSWSNSTGVTVAGFGFVSGSTFNAIDPAPFVDPATGNWWLSFGSFFDGIHIIQLNPTTGLPMSSNTATYPIVSVRIGGEEGSFTYPWMVNGTQYYYFFAPINVCCSATSPYRTIVGRSTSPNGPFVDRGGLALTSSGGTILLSTHGNVVGPGGGSVFTDMVGGVPTPTFVYHYYDGNNAGTPTLGINRLGFTADGWPYVE